MRNTRVFNRITAALAAAAMAVSIFGTSVCAAGTSGATTYVTTANVNVRSGAGTSASIVATAKKGTAVSVVGEVNGWAKLSDGNYVKASYLENADSVINSTSTDILQLESYKMDMSAYNTGVRHGVRLWWLDHSTATSLIKNWDVADHIVSQYGTHYYAVESATPNGREVQKLKTGDLISVDGVTYQIEGRVESDYNTANLAEVWESIGYKFCIQTCIPPYGGPIGIWYGSPVETATTDTAATDATTTPAATTVAAAQQ